MSETRPIGEQLRFVSAKTGAHNLDSYLEAAERGTRTLSDILTDMWDPTTGAFRTGIYQFRFNSTAGLLQFRIGDFAGAEVGWVNIPGTTVLGDLASITAQANAAAASQIAAATSATTATNQAGISTTQATTATNQASLATTARTAAEAALDSFDDRYLGPKAANPSLDNDGNTLLTGALYFNTTSNEMRAWNGSAWQVTYNPSTSGVTSFNTRTGVVSPAANDYAVADINGLTAALAAKSATGHGHIIADTTGLQAALDAKAATSHSHPAADISDATTDSRAIITAANHAAIRTLLGLVIGTNVQAHDADLDAIAALTTTAFGRSFLPLADAAAARTLIAAVNRAGDNLTGPVGAVIAGGAAKGSIGTGTATFNRADGEKQTITVTGAHTWAFSGWPATGTYGEIEVIATNAGAAAITLPTVQWLKGDGTTSTTFSSMGVTLQASGVNHFYFWTTNGGSTIFGRAA